MISRKDQLGQLPVDTARGASLVEIAIGRGAHQPDDRAYTFIEFNPQPVEQHLTYGELDARARLLASRLSEVALRQDRALLIFRPGLDFIVGFFGCLYAGVVAIPVPMPRLGRGLERLRHVMRDSGATVAIGTRSVRSAMESMLEADGNVQWICTDESSAGALLVETPADVDELALLQYSSGSTGHPKGVMISGRNLMHQCAALCDLSLPTADSRSVCWVPPFHDLGLVFGIVQPMYAGYTGVLMAPEAFVQEPYRWLKALCDYRADISAAPNFAFELCVRKITPEQRAQLDLSHWRVAWVGAEPVRAKALREFVQMFSAQGFSPAACCPGFGLAEATLIVAATRPRDGITDRWFKTDALEQNQVVPALPHEPHARCLVACGKRVSGSQTLIVDPESHRSLGEDAVGEIWTSSASVGNGYWGLAEATAETFQARVANSGAGPFLRTGDLGFFHEGLLYICGRIKDLILIHGRNHHAPDIETTVADAHAAFRPSCTAAFALDVDDEERLIVVQEIGRGTETAATAIDDMFAAIRRAIVEHHEIQVHAIVLLRQGTLPKTLSGKVRRSECRSRYLSGKLHVSATWSAASSEPATGRPRTDALANSSGRIREIERWLIEEVASRVGRPASQIDVRTSFADLGVPIGDFPELSRALSQKLGRPLPVSLLMDVPSIEEIIRQQVDHEGRKLSAPEPAVMTPAHCSERIEQDPIAIIGMGCRFPGAEGPEEFWRLMCDGVDAVTEVPPERWNIDEVYDPNPLAVGKMSTRCGGFLKDIDQLDRKFFGLSVREAIRMDPQHRLMMEVAWEALADAGLDAYALSGTPTGVFVGISGSDYAQTQFSDPSLTDAYAGLGCALTVAASRVSHSLNLHGPAIAVDTACSSSLAAVHLACRSLRQGECSVALAGGVNILLSAMVTMCLSKAGMMSPDGRCKAFDVRANGYVRSEGAGMVVLKPLSRALADGDPVYAVIRGSASNQDGRGSGIAAPNGEAQQAVILSACRNAGVAPGDLDYVEAHGTGTAVGDPIEANALGAVLRSGRAQDDVCAIGSVKTNIGHTESAAGIASVIKVAMILRSEYVPASLHFENANPLIPFDELPIRVQTQLGRLPRRSRPLLAGVNGFGVGGTNVHLVLEQVQAHEEPATPISEASDRPLVLPISARSLRSLQANAAAMAGRLRDADGDRILRDACHTLAVRRCHFEHRMVAVGSNASELADALDGFASQGHHAVVSSGFVPPAVEQRNRLAFVFSGQGSQWAQMGCGLLAREPVFRAVVEECDALLKPLCHYSLLEELNAAPETSRLGDTAVAQPAIFAVQVALAALWRSWGIMPDIVLGHSIGEVAAAHVAGALTLPDAIWLVAHRAQLMQQATGLGRMASVELSCEELEPLLAPWADSLAIAAVNSPTSVVVSGESGALESLLATLQAAGAVTVPLPVNYAFHSPQMEPFKQQLTAALHDFRPHPTQIRMISTVTGTWCEGESLDAKYWGDNVRNPVLLSAAVAKLAEEGIQAVVEVGAHPVLAGAMSRTLKALGSNALIGASLRRDSDEQKSLLSTFGALYAHGLRTDWRALYPSGRVCQSLPRYAWDRQRYWLDTAKKGSRSQESAHPLLARRLGSAEPIWETRLDARAFPFARHLTMGGRTQLPKGLLIAAASAAGHECLVSHAIDLVDLTFAEDPIVPDTEAAPGVQISASVEPHGGALLRVSNDRMVEEAEGADWKAALTARASPWLISSMGSASSFDLGELQARCADTLEGAALYRKLDEIRVQYGPSLSVVDYVWRGDDEALVRLHLPDSLCAQLSRYHLHPVVVEAAIQSARIIEASRAGHVDLAHVQRVRVLRACPPDTHIYVYARLRPVAEPGDEHARGDLWLLDDCGAVIAALEGTKFVAAQDVASTGIPTEPENWLWTPTWRSMPLPDVRHKSVPGGWLLITDTGGAGDRLAALFRGRGERCVLVRHGEHFARISRDELTVSPHRPQEFSRALSEAFPSEDFTCRGVVHLSSLDASTAMNGDIESITQSQSVGTISILHTIQALAANGFRRHPRLWLITRAAQRVHAQDNCVAAAQTTIWGMAKAIVLEHPEFRCARVDLGQHPDLREIDSLFAECSSDGREDQIALRGADRYVARLVAAELDVHGENGDASAEEPGDPLARPFRASLNTVEAVRCTVTEPVKRRAPGVGEVEIEVMAVGMRDCDFNRAQGGLGGECLGVVTRLGAGVDRYSLGEEVVALAPDCLASHITVSAAMVLRRPPRLRAEEAATSIRSFAIALRALRDHARLAPGESVLIHSAGSSIGLAAVQVARAMGAKVIATTWTATERALLERLGAAHVLSPAALSFASEARKLTGGAGVDVVLNCLSPWSMGECVPAAGALARCVQLASPPGDAVSPPLQLAGNLSLSCIDFDALLETRAADLQLLMEEAAARLGTGEWIPAPVEKFSYGQLDAALTRSSERDVRVRHAVMLTRIAGQANAAADTVVREDATYLITGGLGALGLSLAQRFVERGARHLVLLGRRAPAAAAQLAISAMRARGAQIHIASVDVADEADLRTLFEELRRQMPLIRGIVHAAGILDNGLLTQLDETRFRRVMDSKVAGAWNLHRLSDDLPLDFFVMYSSLAAIIGSPGQSNYASGNGFLDGLAVHRHARGQPGLSICWGPWAEIGMAAAVHNALRLVERGVGMLPPEQALDLFEMLIDARHGGVVGALAMNWPLWGAYHPSAAQAPFISELVAGGLAAGSSGEIRLTAEMLASLDEPSRIEKVKEAIHKEVCQALRLQPQQLAMDISLSAVGLDSIVALELKSRIDKALGVAVQTATLIKGPSVAELAAQLLPQLLTGESMQPGKAAAAPASSFTEASEARHLLEKLDQLSDEEVTSLLEKMTATAT